MSRGRTAEGLAAEEAVGSRRRRVGRKRVRRTLSEWRRLFSAQQESGLSALEFCRLEGISPWVFYRARKRVERDREEEREPGPAAEPAGASRAESAHRFVELRVGRTGSPDWACHSDSPDWVCRSESVPDPSRSSVRLSERVSTDAVASVPARASGVEIVRGDGTRIRLSCGFDAETFARAMLTLASIGRDTEESALASGPNRGGIGGYASTRREWGTPSSGGEPGSLADPAAVRRDGEGSTPC